MEITKDDANSILWWASIADNESMCYDKTNVIGRIKKSFPSLISEWDCCTFFQDSEINRLIEFHKNHPSLDG